MTFDQFANQGGSAAWDSDDAAATKRAAAKIFHTDDAEAPDDDASLDDSEAQDERPGETVDR